MSANWIGIKYLVSRFSIPLLKKETLVIASHWQQLDNEKPIKSKSLKSYIKPITGESIWINRHRPFTDLPQYVKITTAPSIIHTKCFSMSLIPTHGTLFVSHPTGRNCVARPSKTMSFMNNSNYFGESYKGSPGVKRHIWVLLVCTKVRTS